MGVWKSLKNALSGVKIPTDGIWNALSSFYGNYQANKNVDKQLAAQAKENAMMRDYNLRLAKLQNQWNLQQWNLENAYNSPAAQMERLRQAGLNPDMMYGGGLEGNLSASSPEMTSGAAATPMDFSALGRKKTIGDAMLESKQLDMMDAQIEKTKQEARGAGHQADILASDALYRDALNQGNLNLTNMSINGISSEIAERAQNITESRQRCIKLQREADNLILEGDKIRATISNLDAETASRKLHDALDTAEVEAKIRQMAASCNLSYAQAKAITQKAVWEIAGMQSDIEVNDATLRQINFTTDTIEFDLNQAKDWDDFERSLGSFTKVCNGLSMVTGAIGLVLGGKSPKPVRGFRN